MPPAKLTCTRASIGAHFQQLTLPRPRGPDIGDHRDLRRLLGPARSPASHPPQSASGPEAGPGWSRCNQLLIMPFSSCVRCRLFLPLRSPAVGHFLPSKPQSRRVPPLFVSGCTAGDQPTMIERNQIVDQLNHRVHRMLDIELCGTKSRAQLADGAENTIEFVAEAARRLVGNDRRGCGATGAAASSISRSSRVVNPPAMALARALSPTRSIRSAAMRRAAPSSGGADKGSGDDVFQHRHPPGKARTT